MISSLEKLIEYIDSDEELFYVIRMSVQWHEESFMKMEKLVRQVMDDCSPERFRQEACVFYCKKIIPAIIGTISQYGFCHTWPQGHTQESYKSFIAERIEQLQKLHSDFMAWF